ncbi:hypothetical protein IQ07DRAFT_677068 [Pyrenochaeta sp. DS3sAY3a]|nr:hypothetical protein IQ07DRAFT_677068 [Pyrenochaeta sp. DS3sAY3a]
MLPKNLLSTYQQYKNDTDNVAQWLASKAKSLGFSSGLSEGSTAGKQKTGKPTKSQQRKNKLASKTNHIVLVKDFITLAEFVVKPREPSVQVPARIGTLLDRTISTRELFADDVSPHLPSNADKKQSDDRHMFFLDVLRKVREIFKPHYSKEYSAPKKAPKSVEEIQNMFALLDVEEPSEAFQNAPTVSTPAPGAGSEVRYTAERPDDLQEDFLSFNLLLFDFSKLRSEVGRSWQGYQQGLVDLIAASIVTNTAVDLARSLEEDLQHIIDRRGGVKRMLTIFYVAQCVEHNTTEAFRERMSDDINFKMYQVADSMLWIPFTLLSAFLNVLQPGTLPEMKPGYYGTYTPSSPRGAKSARDKFKEDKILMLEMLSEFLVLCIGTPLAPAEDELTRGLRETFKTKKITLWVVFAVQLFLDIHNTLRAEVDQAFASLSDVASLVRNSIKNTFEFHKDLRIENWPKENDQFMSQFIDQISHYILGDPQRAAARRLKRVYLPKPYLFFRQHPWLCGLWKYHIQVRYHELSITFANAWGAVIHCGHLYNAARSEKLLARRWTDMELAFAIRDYTSFFVGSPPNNPDDYLKRYALAVAASVTNFPTSDNRNGRRARGVQTSSRGPQGLSEQAPVLQTFKERYCDAAPRYDLRAEDITKILQKSEWQYEMDEHNFPTEMTKDSDNIPASKAQGNPVVALPKLLAILRAGMHAEIMELSYDYLTLHRFCWRLLRAVKDSCRDQLIKMYGPEYIEKESQLPFLVGYIFMAATNAKQMGGFLKLKKTDVVTSAVLVEAAGAIEGMLEAGAGGVVGTILKEKLKLDFEFEEE